MASDSGTLVAASLVGRPGHEDRRLVDVRLNRHSGIDGYRIVRPGDCRVIELNTMGR